MLRFFGWVVFGFVLFAPPALAEESPPPNVLLILVDDLKPTIGCYGDTAAKTPNIDNLASRGTLFEAAYCNQAVCSPSRNAFLTGLRPQTLGIYDLPTNFRVGRPDAVTIGQCFAAAGYRTEAMGKVFHVGHGNREDQASWTVPHFRPRAQPYASRANAARPADKGGGAATEALDVSDDVYADGQVALHAMRRLEHAARLPDEPFLMAVGFIRPHLPFVAPRRYWNMYDPLSLPMPQTDSAPENAPDYAGSNWGELRKYSGIPDKGPLPSEQIRHLIHGYYAATSYTDTQIGRVLAKLRETGLDENTIVVLWGDHGWHLGDHGMWCKHTNYEQATRIPLIIARPGGETRRSDGLIESVDVYPTLCSLAGFEPPEDIDGVDQSAMLEGGPSARSFAVSIYPRGNRMGQTIRTQRYRLIEWRSQSNDEAEPIYELYDYQDDPLETVNLAASRPDIVRELIAKMDELPEPKYAPRR